MIFTILTTFPQYFESPLDSSIIHRAISNKIIDVNLIDLRQFTNDKHKTTDDRPFGGGAGMVMKIEPIEKALATIPISQPKKNRTILLSARGNRFVQTDATRLATYQSVTLICGHYGDVDQRVADYLVDEEISLGDFVMTGGEPAALVMIDAISRLLPNVLGNEASIVAESHARPGISSPPSFTRPADYHGWKVPDVLLSGNAAAIKAWKADYLDSSDSK